MIDPIKISRIFFTFFGDAVLYRNISRFIKDTRRFMSPHLMTQLRTCYIRNSSLARVFDNLRLDTLFQNDDFRETEKIKSDVVESIIGELSNKGCDQLLNEFIAFIAYSGEEIYFKEAFDSFTNGNGKSIHDPLVIHNIIDDTEDDLSKENMFFYKPKNNNDDRKKNKNNNNENNINENNNNENNSNENNNNENNNKYYNNTNKKENKKTYTILTRKKPTNKIKNTYSKEELINNETKKTPKIRVVSSTKQKRSVIEYSNVISDT